MITEHEEQWVMEDDDMPPLVERPPNHDEPDQDENDDDLPPISVASYSNLPNSLTSSYTFIADESSTSSSVLSTTLTNELATAPRGRTSQHNTHLEEPGYIPRPPNAFILFRSSFIRSQKISGKVEPNHSMLSKIIGRYWRQLPPSERQEWEAKAKVAQDEHRMRYPDWRFRPASGGKAGRGSGSGRGRGKGGRKGRLKTKDGGGNGQGEEENSGDEEDPNTPQTRKGKGKEKQNINHSHAKPPKITISIPSPHNSSKDHAASIAGPSRSSPGRTTRSSKSPGSLAPSVSSSTSHSEPSSSSTPKSPDNQLKLEAEERRIKHITALLVQGKEGKELENELTKWEKDEARKKHSKGKAKARPDGGIERRSWRFPAEQMHTSITPAVSTSTTPTDATVLTPAAVPETDFETDTDTETERARAGGDWNFQSSPISSPSPVAPYIDENRGNDTIATDTDELRGSSADSGAEIGAPTLKRSLSAPASNSRTPYANSAAAVDNAPGTYEEGYRIAAPAPPYQDNSSGKTDNASVYGWSNQNQDASYMYSDYTQPQSYSSSPGAEPSLAFDSHMPSPQVPTSRQHTYPSYSSSVHLHPLSATNVHHAATRTGSNSEEYSSVPETPYTPSSAPAVSSFSFERERIGRTRRGSIAFPISSSVPGTKHRRTLTWQHRQDPVNEQEVAWADDRRDSQGTSSAWVSEQNGISSALSSSSATDTWNSTEPGLKQTDQVSSGRGVWETGYTPQLVPRDGSMMFNSPSDVYLTSPVTSFPAYHTGNSPPGEWPGEEWRDGGEIPASTYSSLSGWDGFEGVAVGASEPVVRIEYGGVDKEVPDRVQGNSTWVDH